MENKLFIETSNRKIELFFYGELTLYTLGEYEKLVAKLSLRQIQSATINIQSVTYLDTAGALFIKNLMMLFQDSTVECEIISLQEKYFETLELVKRHCEESQAILKVKSKNFIYKLGEFWSEYYTGFIGFMEFLGLIVFTKLHYLKSYKNIRFKEIAFEINESSIKALGIIALTSFLIGLVVAYQSAYQLKIYGANIFIVDMLGISILRELAPLITAIVIAGRSGSAFSAQIGAMKITQELDAMRTMGFDPYIFLVMPRILALMLMMPFLIFVADVMGLLGGALVASVDLGISFNLFIERFNEAVAVKHFFVGLVKGPFFAFLIASIGIYRGLVVKDDTQSIGFNTTKSVVESIFAVIVCDAIFSILFTNLGI